MARTRMVVPAVATSIVLLALAAPAPAAATTPLDAYTRLAKLRLRTPPLVPITAPRILSLDTAVVEVLPSRRRGGYGVRLVHFRPSGRPDAIIAVEGGAFSSVSAALREERRAGFRARRTRVRGRRGYVLTRRYPRPNVQLIWLENRVVYTVGTGTTRKISLSQLRATAADLDPLEREYIGSVYDQSTDNNYGAVLVTTKRTVSGNIEWSAQCRAPDGSITSARAGSMDVSVASRSGNSFSFALEPSGDSPDPWTGHVSGTVSRSAITVSLRATLTLGGDTCDTGQVTITADKRSI